MMPFLLWLPNLALPVLAGLGWPRLSWFFSLPLAA